ncbi:putative transporter [Actinacidiphila reveromycinica]|uniref:Putative transporter n=1 Tax=Actinacidiphila reveromycinica TaxID=659352 RepID=A0A7U3UST1_9ACTN|nr:MFS transporter [Streptomyces sp. SN-593]BBA98031.1 putative transporter [Streptomyces sp. SN-593]
MALTTASPADAAGAPAPPDEPARALRWVIITLAFACGASVANLYYAQPLLGLLSHSFGVSKGTATIVVTATQIGYALGLALLIPLGDLLENRRLASRTLLVTALALAVAAFSPDFWVFLAVSVLIGVTSVVAQILVPLAAHLAPAESRGRLVGQVMSGLLLGIMLARSVASFAAAAWGWRSIYAISAVVMLLTSLALLKVLPVRKPEHSARYGALLASVAGLVRSEPVLVRRALTQASMFGAFTAYWTAVAYELADRHHMSQNGIAVFALVGAAGAASAPVAGRLGDAGRGVVGRAVAILTGLVAMVLAGFGVGNLVLLAIAGVLLDFAVQGHQVLSQRDIYALRPDARARVNSVYMTTVFLGGAAASAATGAVHSAWGWTGVSVMGGALTLVAFALWSVERFTGHGARRP